MSIPAFDFVSGLLAFTCVVGAIVSGIGCRERGALENQMVLVPAGKFLFGEKEREPENHCKRDFFVSQRLEETGEFYIDRFEVTNRQYAAFVEATGHPALPHWNGAEPPSELLLVPVTFVSFEDAQAYARWAGKRLPSEKEWEKAARGTDGRRYPWGNALPDADRAVFFRMWGDGPRAIGERPGGASPFGCEDMAGNVLEWTSTRVEGTDERIVRGGDWANVKENLRTSRRTVGLYDIRSGDLGFRCAADELPAGATLWQEDARGKSSGKSAHLNKRIAIAELKRPDRGVHPRLFFTPKELPEIKSHIEGTELPTRAWSRLKNELKKAWAEKGPVKRFCNEVLEKKNLQAKLPGNLETFGFTAFHALITEDKENAERARKAVLALAKHAEGADKGNYATIAHLALAYDLGFNFLTEEERGIVRQGLIHQCGLMVQLSKVSFWGLGRPSYYRAFDWCPLFNTPVGIAALALEGEMDESTRREWERIATGAVQDYMQVGIGKDGSCFDGLAYFGFANWFTGYFLDGLRMRGLDLYQHPHLKKVPEWLALEVLPWQHEFNTFGKTFLRPTVGLIFASLYHAYPESREMKWAWYNHGSFRTYTCIPNIVFGGSLPESDPEGLALARHFRDRALVIARTDWSTDGVMFATRYGREVHAQTDTGSFTLSGYGSFFVIDPGLETRLSEGHSITKIDGKSLGTDFSSTEGRIRDYRHSAFATMVHGDAAHAYNYYYPWKPQEGKKVKSMPVEQADRYFVFVTGKEAPPYLMMREQIKMDGARHTYQWLLQLSPGAACEVSGDSAEVSVPLHGDRHNPAKNGPGNRMTINFFSPAALKLSVDTFGKKSMDYGIHPRLKADASGIEGDFAVLLYPRQESMPEPRIEREELPGGIYVRLRWPGATDHWLFADPGKSIDTERISSDAPVALVRECQGKVPDFLGFSARGLRWGKKALFRSEGKTNFLKK